MPKLNQEDVDRLLDQHYRSFKIRFSTGLEGNDPPEDLAGFTEAYLADLKEFVKAPPKGDSAITLFGVNPEDVTGITLANHFYEISHLVVAQDVTGASPGYFTCLLGDTTQAVTGPLSEIQAVFSSSEKIIATHARAAWRNRFTRSFISHP